ncbi:hypothetical protein CDL15_Pgr023453 [Punica granatum]|uniref:Uncharacterized protein n=1 Tax=Punica granatum TaxID=22663 RepID=A0A218VRJ5_PUNGR|nr:hypothetical protein CDL15_Pgr023453 [Punica granatum]
MQEGTKTNRGSRDAKLHSERPNRAKPTPEVPNRPSGMQEGTKINRGSRDAKLHSERPNRTKPTPEAPNRPNVHSRDAWRY